MSRTECPLVSVVTATWQRHDLVLELIENIRAQTYRPLEHVIVADGPDEALCGLILEQAYEGAGRYDDDDDPRRVPIRFVELGFHASSFFSFSVSAPPFLMAQMLARGELQMWASDDERFAPDHIESLVDLLYERDVDWVAPQIACQLAGSDAPPVIIGIDPPTQGHVSHALYRRELLDYRHFRMHIGSGTDWDQASAWQRAGASFALLERVTMTHRVDKYGEGDLADVVGQPLRGRGGKGAYYAVRWKGYALDAHQVIVPGVPRHLHPDDRRGDAL